MQVHSFGNRDSKDYGMIARRGKTGEANVEFLAPIAAARGPVSLTAAGTRAKGVDAAPILDAQIKADGTNKKVG
jgi:hypothetical protein